MAAHARLHAAGVLLKNLVDKSWVTHEDAADGSGPAVAELPAEAKTHIKDMVLEGLADPNRQIRALMAATATRIVNIEGTELWPRLMTALMGSLRSGIPDHVDGAMRVMSELVEDISEAEFANIAPSLLPDILRVLCSPEAFPPRTRAKSIHIYRKFVETLKSVERAYPEAISRYLLPSLPEWMSAFRSCLLAADGSSGNLYLQTQTLKAIEQLSSSFANHARVHVFELAPLIWAGTRAVLPRYVADEVLAAEDGNLGGTDPGYDSDGESIGFASYLFAFFELMCVLAERVDFKPLFSEKKAPTPLLVELASACYSFAQISREQ
ncbi:Importin 9, partial [Cladochytrium tenue]